MAESYVSSSTRTSRTLRPPAPLPTSLSFHIHTLGCKVNQADSTALRRVLTERGHEWCEDPARADVVIVNTCTVTAESDKKSRKAARHFARMGTSLRVILTGCMPAAGAAPAYGMPENVLIIASRDDVPDALGVAGPRGAERPVSDGALVDRARVQLKVQDGCDNHCTYCIVPTARGVSRSVPFADVLQDAARATHAGAQEVVLTGIDLGDYSDAGMDVADLMTAIGQETGVTRIRLSSMEPMHITEQLIEKLAAEPSFCRHLHIPLQSGSDEVLEAMGRPYAVAEYLDLVERVRSAMPTLAITTDLMVGFPGETEANHVESLRTCKAAGFSKMHVFRYSARPGTPAARRGDGVAPEVARERSESARALGLEMALEFMESLVGCDLELLLEQESAGSVTGTTREYARATVPAEGVPMGTIMRIRAVGVGDSLVLARPA